GNGTGGNGALQSVGGGNTVGDVRLADNARIQSDSGLLTVSGTVDLFIYSLTIAGAGDSEFQGVITDAAFGATHVPGLLVGRFAGDPNNEFDPNPGNEGMQLGTNYAQTNQLPPWADNVTFIYTGEFFDAD